MHTVVVVFLGGHRLVIRDKEAHGKIFRVSQLEKFLVHLFHHIVICPSLKYISAGTHTQSEVIPGKIAP